MKSGKRMINEFFEKQKKEGLLDGSIWEYELDILQLMQDFTKQHIKALYNEIQNSNLSCINTKDFKDGDNKLEEIFKNYLNNKIQ